MVAARRFRYVTLHRNVHRITLITLHPMMYVASPRISQATSTSSSISACIHLPLQSWNLLNAWFAVQDLESLQKVQKWLLNFYQFPRPQRVLQVCPTYPYLAKQSGGSFRLDQWSRNCWARIWNAFLSATSAASHCWSKEHSLKTYGGQWKSGRTGSFRENRQFKLDQSKPIVSFCRTFEDLFNLGSGVIEEVLESSKCGKRWDVSRCETPETSRILKLLASGHHPLSFLVIGTWKGGGSCAPNRGKMA